MLQAQQTEALSLVLDQLLGLEAPASWGLSAGMATRTQLGQPRGDIFPAHQSSKRQTCRKMENISVTPSATLEEMLVLLEGLALSSTSIHLGNYVKNRVLK